MFCSITVKGEEEIYPTFKAFQENGNTSGTACITGLVTGVYSILVCNANCFVSSTSQITYVYHNVSIIGIGMFANCYHYMLH